MSNGASTTTKPSVAADLITHTDGRTYFRTGECDGCLTTRPGQCCTFIVLPLAREMSSDEVRWIELHPGLSVRGKMIQIETACSALEGGRCTLFGKAERPDLCVRYPEQPNQMLAGCSYTLTEV